MKKCFLYVFLVAFLFNLEAYSQTCSCVDCPVQILDVQTVNSVLNVSGLTNSTLNSGGQSICGISLEYDHSWISDIEIILVAPNGSSIFLLPDGGGSSNFGSTWDITFLPCGDPVIPDPGDSDEYTSNDFGPGTSYTGSYYPGNGCFSDLTGSANGEWNLQINDLVFADIGEVTNWSITFCDGDGLDCSALTCEAELGDYSLQLYTFCESDDPITLDPSITGGQTDSDYNTTFVITTNVGGFPDEIIGYREDADLTGYAAGLYYACGINYLISDESLLPTSNAGNTYSDLEDLISNGTICGDLVEFDCLLVLINSCSCTAESGTINISDLQFCASDNIDLNPTVNNENDGTDYSYTFSISNYSSGSIGTIAGYTETGNLTGYAAGQYWVCGLSYLTTDELLLPPADGSNTNIDIMSDINDGTLCADITPGCYIVDIQEEASAPILDFETEICVGQASSITTTNFDPEGVYGVSVVSGSFSALSTTTPITTFTPQTDLDIEICIVNLSICGNQQTCANIIVTDSSADNIMINGDTESCLDNSLNYNLTGLGGSTIVGWTIFGDATITSANTDPNITILVDNTTTTGEAELCVEIESNCGVNSTECITIDIVDDVLTSTTATDFCEFDFNIEVLNNGLIGTGTWSIISNPGTVIFDDISASSTGIIVDALGNYTLQFTSECGGIIDVDFSVWEPLTTDNVVVICSGESYTISFDVIGGEAPYTVNGVTIFGGSYTSGLIDDNPYIFNISDNTSCANWELTGDPDCNCDSDAGTINPQDLIISCEGQNVTVNSNGNSFLESDDIGIWILYSDIGDPLNSILFENSTGEFTFASPLIYGNTYYIAYIVGNEIGGTVDLTDPCISIADGTSVIFSEPFGLIDISLNPLNSCGTEYELNAIQDSPLAGQWFFTVIPTGGSASLSNNNGSSTIATIEGEGLFTVQYSLTDGICSDLINVVIDEPEIPEATLISSDCSADNLTYQVTINLEGGTNPYSLNGTPITGSTFISTAINSGTNYSFTFTDFNGCESEEFTGSFFCNCSTDAGNMSLELIEICGDSEATAVNDGTEQLDGNDAFVYILHTNAVATIGNILDENLTGTFSFLSSMTYGETYYISSVAGDADGASVDLTDDCLNVANGQPVIWHEQVIINSLASTPEIGCEEFYITVNANTNIEGDWSVNSFPSGGTVNFSTTGNITNVIVDVVGIYNLQYDITNGTCNATEEITIILSEAPTINNITYTCDDANENYQVSFDISGGITPYSVNGTIVAGSSFTSPITPNGVSNDYVITDINLCESEIVTTNNNCSSECITYAGTMPLDTIKSCYDTIGVQPIIQINHNGDAILDGDDIGTYILHLGDSNSILFPFAESPTGTFQYLDFLSYGTTLYVSYVVGNELGGSVDLTDPCTSVSIGQPIIFYQDPRVNLGVDRAFCGLEIEKLYSINTGVQDIVEIWNIIATPVGENIIIDTTDALYLKLTATAPGEYSISYTVTTNQCSTTDTLNIEFLGDISVEVMDDFSTCSSDVEIFSIKSNGQGEWSIPELPELIFDTISDTTTVDLDTFGIFEIIRTISTNSCTSSDTLTVEIFPPSEFVVLGSECDDSNENYSINYELIGDSYPYTINGVEINEGETIELSANSSEQIDIIAFDNNMCEIFNSSITRSCDCESTLLENTPFNYRVCIQDTLIIVPPTFNLAAGDSLIYVLHDSNEDNIVNIIAVSDDGKFVFDPNTMITNSLDEALYFVSPVIYNSGEFSLTSLDLPCTLTLAGNPVFWYAPSLSTIPDQTIEICGGDSVIIPIEHTGQVPLLVEVNTSDGQEFDVVFLEEGMQEIEVIMTESGTVNISNVITTELCENEFTGVTNINIIDAPTLIIQQTTNICSDPNSGNTEINLSDLLIESSGEGIWVDSDGNLITNTQLDFENITDGLYEYTYIINDNGCGSVSSSTIISVNTCLDCPSDVVIPLPEYCEGSFTLDLNEYITSNYIGIGIWTQLIDSEIIPLDNSVISITNDFVGDEEYVYYISGLPIGCDSFFTNILSVIESPNAGELSEVNSTFCVGDNAISNLFDLIIDYDLDGAWSSFSTDEFDVTTGQINLSNLTSDNFEFTYTVESNSVCPSDAITVNIYIVESNNLGFTINDPLCFNGNDGSVSIQDSNGNPIDYSFLITDSNGIEISDLNALSAGIYNVFGQDENGCSVVSGFIVEDPIESFLDLGIDIELNDGDTATINANTNIIEEKIDLYEWFVNQSILDAPSYENLVLSPTNETLVQLSITDQDGCIVSDDILLTVVVDELSNPEVILPNIFNANNSEFGIEPFDKISIVTSFAIYDRWGNKVFLAENYDPFTNNQKWDGSFNGSNAITGVYVFAVQYIDTSGSANKISGDITLLR